MVLVMMLVFSVMSMLMRDVDDVVGGLCVEHVDDGCVDGGVDDGDVNEGNIHDVVVGLGGDHVEGDVQDNGIGHDVDDLDPGQR